MVKEDKVQAQATVKLSHKVISYGDYVAEANKLLQTNPSVNGMNRAADVAIALLYSNNKVVDKTLRGGETVYVCEV